MSVYDIFYWAIAFKELIEMLVAGTLYQLVLCKENWEESAPGLNTDMKFRIVWRHLHNFFLFVDFFR